MKINQTGGNSSAEVTGAHGAKSADKAQARKAKTESSYSGGISADAAKTEISSEARELAHAKHAAAAAPDTREEKIAELKRRIAEGKYHVDANAVADKMVDEHLQMSGIG
jgi:negative regulator of flagellin synthesis FlgM